MTLRGKTILFIGGGRETVPALDTARDLGVEVVVIDGDAVGCDAARAGYRCLQASTYDAQSCVAVAKLAESKGRKFDGVTSVGTDCAFTVAVVASELGLPGVPPSSALIASNKALLKSFLLEREIMTPLGATCMQLEDLDRALVTIGFPCILKPADSRGSRGVFLVRNIDEARLHFPLTLRFSPTATALVEQYIDGLQYSSESVVVNGEPFTVGLSTRNYDFLEWTRPEIVEDGGSLPAALGEKLENQLAHDLARIAAGLSMQNGTIKGALVVKNGELLWIELAVRASGGYLATHGIPLSTGIDLVQAILKIAVGEPIEPAGLVAKSRQYVCQRYLFSLCPDDVQLVIPASNSRSSGLLFSRSLILEGPNGTNAVSALSKVAVVITGGSTLAEAENRARDWVEKVAEVSTGLWFPPNQALGVEPSGLAS